MNEEEKTYKKLAEDLKNLPKVEAHKNFETELWRKINSSEENKKLSFWEKLFSPGRLVPAAAVIVSTVIIFFIVNTKSDKIESPLNLGPKLQEDLVIPEPTRESPVEVQKKSIEQKGKVEKTPEALSDKKDNAPPIPQVINEAVRSESEKMADEKLDKIDAGVSNSDSFKSTNPTNLGGNVTPTSVTTTEQEKIKDSLNLIRMNLSEEKKEVEQSKLKVKAEKSSKTKPDSTKLP
jgi:hypothetical protein